MSSVIEQRGNRMSRLIDADALLSELEDLNKKVDKEAYYTGDRSLSVTWDDAIQAIKSAHTIEPEYQWIPCSERLPEEHIGFYLVTV